jgi:flagellum-specific ATP synthase
VLSSLAALGLLPRAPPHAGHYPAIDVLQSVSRLVDEISARDVATAAQEVRSLLAAWHDKRDLVAIGAYEAGSDPLVDRAIELKPAIDAFLRQPVDAPSTVGEADDGLLALVADDIAVAVTAELEAESSAEVVPIDRAMSYPPSGPVAIPPLNLSV